MPRFISDEHLMEDIFTQTNPIVKSDFFDDANQFDDWEEDWEEDSEQTWAHMDANDQD